MINCYFCNNSNLTRDHDMDGDSYMVYYCSNCNTMSNNCHDVIYICYNNGKNIELFSIDFKKRIGDYIYRLYFYININKLTIGKYHSVKLIQLKAYSMVNSKKLDQSIQIKFDGDINLNMIDKYILKFNKVESIS